MDDTRAVEAPEAPETDQQHSGRIGRMFWSKTSAVLSAALVVVLVGCVIWLTTTRPGPAPATRAPAAHPAVEFAHGCGPAADPHALPPVTAPPTTWKLVGTMAAPYSPAAGPKADDEGIGLCYSPGPVGALFAAANFVAASSSPELRYRVLDKLAAVGPGRDLALAETRQRPGGVTTGVQIAGFTFLSYKTAPGGTAAATVDLALTSHGAFVHVPIALVWDDDWRVQLPITGRLYDHLAVLPDLAGYVPWQGA